MNWKAADIEALAKQRNEQHAKTVKGNKASLQRYKQKSTKKASLEHNIQVSCVKWFRLQYPKLAKLLVSFPNGAKLHNGAKAWKRLEAEGAVAGAPDLVLLVPSGDYGSLCIEMKTKNGRQQDSQKEFERVVVANGGAYCIARSLTQFINQVTAYLERGEF